MKLRSHVASALALFILSLVLLSCSPLTAEPEKPTAEAAKVVVPDATPPSLPVQYQTPSYRVDAAGKDELDSQADDVVLKVGATISSGKKMPLKDIMKPLASQKKLNVSWASDVNQEALVDVNIQANDDFYKAIENLLRQLDYFYELQGRTIVIKYRETKKFHIAMPFSKQSYTTNAGGNALGGGGDETTKQNMEGTIKITSEGNEFDIWKKIEENLVTILKIERTRTITTAVKDATTKDKNGQTTEATKGEATETTEVEVTGGEENYYFIDQTVGLITVTAPRPILDKIGAYFTSLQKEAYKQVSIEAKIIEVQLIDSSSIGINWDSVLKDFSITGALGFGSNTVTTSTASTALVGTATTAAGAIVENVLGIDPSTNTTSNNTDNSTSNTTSNGTTSSTAVMSSGQVWPDVSNFASSVKINTADFGVLISALKTQGTTKVLSNPKISVLNGQPAMISVGRNVTYLKKVTSSVDGTTGTITYTADPGTILSGVGLGITATILNNNEIIMNLVPVTSELLEGTQEAVVVAGEGTTAVKMGLPIVNIREMSTTVRVKDGEMLVIGGLISDTNSEEGNFAPVLGDIPLLKYLFGHEEKVKNKREMIILLKPRII